MRVDLSVFISLALEDECKRKMPSGTTERCAMATKDAAAWLNARKDATIADRRRREGERRRGKGKKSHRCCRTVNIQKQASAGNLREQNERIGRQHLENELSSPPHSDDCMHNVTHLSRSALFCVCTKDQIPSSRVGYSETCFSFSRARGREMQTRSFDCHLFDSQYSLHHEDLLSHRDRVIHTSSTHIKRAGRRHGLVIPSLGFIILTLAGTRVHREKAVARACTHRTCDVIVDKLGDIVAAAAASRSDCIIITTKWCCSF